MGLGAWLMAVRTRLGQPSFVGLRDTPANPTCALMADG